MRSSQCSSAARLAYMSHAAIGAATWMREASLAGMPTSREITRPNSSACSRKAVATRRTAAIRSGKGVPDHASNARRALCTAASTSAAELVWYVAKVSSV